MGVAAGALMMFISHASVALVAIYAVAFVPLVYWTDGWAYRRYQQKKAAGPAPRPRSGR
jgi:hypothetical protein